MADTVFHEGFFRIALWVSLALGGLGLLWRLVTWLTVRIGTDARDVSFGQRLWAAIGGGVGALFSRRLPGMMGAFFLDVLFQRRLFATSKLRWAGHLMILVGFTALLVMHALAAWLSGKLFDNYYATLNPFLLLRNVFGAMAVVGVVLLALGRRRDWVFGRPARRPADGIFAALLAVVLVSGFLLEAQKIASPKAFYRMTDEFGLGTDAEELAGLRWVWKQDYGVAFTDLHGEPDADVLAEGRELNTQACVDCHARPQSAFVSYPMARAMAPVTATLDAANADRALLWLHVLACLLGIVVLPFTRFFHAVADPVSLVARGAAASGPLSLAGRVSRRALAADACIRCGLCDARCSVAPIARWLDNPELLPSRKVQATRRVAGRAWTRIGDGDADRLAQGAHLCTDCGRCTLRCPVGLDLGDLWDAGRDDLAARGLPAPATWIQEHPAIAWAEALGTELGRVPPAGPLSADRRTFSACVQCQTCTNVCPVVAHGGTDADRVDLTPQKVMNLLRLGMVDLALGSRMVWDCATCYQCQENCPEGIRVTDVMLELRGAAWRQLSPVRERRRPE